MPPTRQQILSDPGFYRNPLTVQEEILSAYDPQFSALGAEDRQATLLHLSSQNMQKEVDTSAQTGGSLLGPLGQLPEGAGRVIRGESIVPKAEPGAIQKFSLSRVPTNILTGIGNIPSLVTAPVSAYKTLRGTPLTEEQKLAALQKLQKEGIVSSLKEIGTKAAPQLEGLAQGAASGLTWGTLDNLLPPPVSKEQEAARVLGQYGAGALSGKAAFDAAKTVMRPALARLTVPPLMGAAPGLAQGDLNKAIEGATTGLGAAGIGELAGRGAAPLLEHYSPANRALRAESKSLGGGQGILSEINKQIVESNTPGLSEAGYDIPASVVEGGQTIQNAGKLAGKHIRAVMSERLNNEVRPLAPADAIVPDSHSEQFRILSTEGPEALRSAVQKKLGKLGAVEEETGGGTARSGWAAKAADMLGKANLSEAQKASMAKQATELYGAIDETTAKEMKNLFGNTEVGQGAATPNNLIDLYQALGEISTPNDKSARYVALAKEAVRADLKTIGGDFYKSWDMWNKDFGRDVGQYHGKNAPLRKLYERTYGRPEEDASTLIANLAKGTAENATNVIEGIKAGPNGPAAVDNISAATWQHLLEKNSTEIGTTNLKSWVRELSQPAQRRVLEPLLGPRYEAAMNLRKALIDTGLHEYEGTGATALRVWEGFHAVRGLLKLAGGNVTGAAYHLGTAGQMSLNSGLIARLANNKAGAKLLAAGLLERPGTPRATVIVDKLAKMADEVGGEQVKSGNVSEADVTPPPGFSPTRGLPQPTIYQGPPPGPLGIPPPGPGNRPVAPIAPLPDLPMRPAVASAQVFKEAELAQKAFLQSPQGKEALARSLRAKEAAARGKYADTDQTVQDLRTLFGGDNSFGPNLDEHTLLTNLLRDKTAPANLKDMARSVLQKYPKPVIPPIGPLIPEDVAMVKQAAPADIQAKVKAVGDEVLGAHPADVIRARQKANVEAFQSGAPKSKPEYVPPVRLMNQITKNPKMKTTSKILVPDALMEQSLKPKYGEKATEWFTTDQTEPGVQPIDNVIDQFAADYGIEPTYNAFKDHLDAAYETYKPAKRMTTIRRKGDTRTKAEKAEAARIIAEKRGK